MKSSESPKTKCTETDTRKWLMWCLARGAVPSDATWQRAKNNSLRDLSLTLSLLPALSPPCMTNMTHSMVSCSWFAHWRIDHAWAPKCLQAICYIDFLGHFPDNGSTQSHTIRSWPKWVSLLRQSPFSIREIDRWRIARKKYKSF